jgi:hypothetical protein
MRSGLFDFDGRVEEHIHCIQVPDCCGCCLQINSRSIFRAFV